VAAQRTKKLKFLMLGNLVPLHNPLRIAEELAMADTMSRGRILSGFARGVPREYNVYGVPMSESRARFEEAVDIILKAWTESKFSYEGKFWSYKDISIWPRPYTQPHPPVWVPFTGSKETIEWAGKHNFSAVIPDNHRGLTQDIVAYFAKQLHAHGNKITPEHMCFFTDAYVAKDRETAIKEYSPSYLYFVHTLWHHGSLEKASQAKGTGYLSSSSMDHVRPENRVGVGVDREGMQKTTMADIERKISSGELSWGSPKDVADNLIEGAERMGANSLLLNMNVGAMSHDVFLEQIRRFGRDVLPRLQAHQVKRVPAAETVAA
jgi:alkanesulfonate monooxygenase SsuD/methylene tetrahydromethanopterin reductase-like flavin-dependent oxidoreductase (luciferase family)